MAAKFPKMKILAASPAAQSARPTTSSTGCRVRRPGDVIPGSDHDNGALATQSGGSYVAGKDLLLYDQMKMDDASRL